jgi:threonine synthase
VSTRGGDEATLCEAMSVGLARDGGLYLPEACPTLSETRPLAELSRSAYRLLAPLFDDETLAPDLAAICEQAFAPGVVMRALSPTLRLLELFHGPTAAFKDFGARFLAECLRRLRSRSMPMTILVATSGDTGAAVASAFHGHHGFRVVVLYPDGRVSPRQAHQLGAFGGNVTALRVAGTFDDCQRMVKTAFADTALASHCLLGSANSISLGRLLPQAAYFAHAASQAFAEDGAPVSFIVPTGNLGNAFAALVAKKMGFPIDEIVLATNANQVLPRYFETGRYEPTPSVVTLANAMDVGAPSNFERLERWFPSRPPGISADWVDDETIRQTILSTWREFGVAVCPHTACGLAVWRRLEARGRGTSWIVAATAHPAKFDSIVEPLLGRPIPVPAALEELLRRPSAAEPTLAEYSALRLRLLDVESKGGVG